VGKLSEEINRMQPVAVKAAIVAGIMFYPISLIHEGGHALVCTSVNGTFSWEGFFMLAVRCSQMPQDSLYIFWSLGGIFGMISGSLFLISKKIHQDKPILAGVLTIIFSHFVNTVFETFAHNAYLNNIITSVLMTSSIGIFFFILLRCITRKSK
jgi:hypothetical protein